MSALPSLRHWLGTWVFTLIPIFHLKASFLASVKQRSSILKIYIYIFVILLWVVALHA